MGIYDRMLGESIPLVATRDVAVYVCTNIKSQTGICHMLIMGTAEQLCYAASSYT